ncbi:MAG: dTDP-4-dehydrorhamnose reductase [Moraxellaceae bacterium]|nr:dTDP-4-dehydrorhamnose reductase [Moraxellaceae bacterium]
MKILLFGKTGQVGWELQRSLAPLGDVVALASKSTDLCGDFTNLTGLAETVRRVQPDVIVNAAAYTAVDKAESEPELALTVNALAPEVLAVEAARQGALLVHYSTDYVFDGTGTEARREDAPTGPLSVYGRTKLEGEARISGAGCRHLIFRTSWVYAARGGNFAKTMLRLGSEREVLNVIDDQVGSPTGAELIADVTAHAVQRFRPELGGIHHLVAAGETSWHEYARFVLDIARKRGMPLKLQELNAIPTSAYPTPARRPHNSRLDRTRLEQSFGLLMPAWQAGVLRMLDEVLQ